jgi:serine phosphatase RsbU (regulator of sigma subunit)
MEQALLATSVPVVPDADITAEYLVAAEDTATGGDWFDATIVGDG